MNVILKSTYNLATGEGHPTANELRNAAKNLEKETQQLEVFSKCFNKHIEGKGIVNQLLKIGLIYVIFTCICIAIIYSMYT